MGVFHRATCASGTLNFCRLLFARLCKMELFVAFAALSLLCAFTSGDDSAQDAFNVKPGPQMVHEEKLGDYNCRFEYQAQGGTNEQWYATLETLNDGGAIRCTVERGQTSYLYFQKFKLTLSGPGVELVHAEAVDTGTTLLGPEAFVVDHKSNSVSDVQGKFKNHLEKVRIDAVIAGKNEL